MRCRRVAPQRAPDAHRSRRQASCSPTPPTPGWRSGSAWRAASRSSPRSSRATAAGTSTSTTCARGEGCKVLFFASPCMPVGTVFTRTRRGDRGRPRRTTPGSCSTATPTRSRSTAGPCTTRHVCGDRDRTLVVGCMSKNYLMPGWRIGWAAGPRAVMGAMEDVHIFNGDHAERDHPGRGGRGARRAAGLAGRGGRTYARRQSALLEAALASAPPVGDRGRGRLLLPARHLGHGVRGNGVRGRLLAECDVAVTPMQGWGTTTSASTSSG